MGDKDRIGPPETRLMDHRLLGDYLVKKDWRDTFFIIQGKDDSGRPTPISRFLGGKVVLFPYEYHSDLKPGETWECQLIEDNPTFMKAVPIRKISNIRPNGDALPPMPPNLAQVFVDAIETKKNELTPNLLESEKRYGKCEERSKELREELHKLEQEMNELEDRVLDMRSELDSYERALKHYRPQIHSPQDMSDQE